MIRGKVTSPSGHGLISVRVGVVGEQLGFVLTREGGYFDIMVNGGLAVTLDFYRDPYPKGWRTINVPWNEIVVIDDVRLGSIETTSTSSSPLPSSPSSSIIVGNKFVNENRPQANCGEHDYDLIRPIISTKWKHSSHGTCMESQIVHESIRIPSTNINLVYHSSRSSGYLSTIDLQLTPNNIPETLRFIHLKITLEGNLEEKLFEADSNLKFTYSWNRRNVYRQNVFGMATALIHVGYEYLNCPTIIWNVQTVQVRGHDLPISDIGGWNLDIHHQYNFHEGILHKGNGSNIYLKNRPPLMVTLMGDGQQRPLYCAYCNGHVREQRLLAPVALTSGADGSIFVGDFNLIRRIAPNGQVTTIVELSASQVAYRYHLAIGLSDHNLYISDPERHQILRVINSSEPVNPRENVEIIVGSGLKCLPGDKLACGDGKSARDARLTYPKGIAVSLLGEIFIADGTNIRYVDTNGLIHTLIGDHFHKLHWKPFPCSGIISSQKYSLRWPTELAINPIDNSLNILDDHMVLKLTSDKRLKIIAGRPNHCFNHESEPVIGGNKDAANGDSLLAIKSFLETPQSIAFSSNGNLFIAESDSQSINRIRMVTHDGHLIRYAGTNLKCSCMENNCDCFNSDVNLALNSKMSSIASITISPDGSLHLCDQGNVRIRSIIPSLPKPDNNNGDYEIISPETDEIYIFNRFGQHKTTKNMRSGKSNYNFSYTVNTPIGRLNFVTDSEGDKIQLLRDYSNIVKTIENSKGAKCKLDISSRSKMLQVLTLPNGHNYNFEYIGNLGLLKNRIDSIGPHSISYEYDQFGRLIRATQPNGQPVIIKCDSNSELVNNRMAKNGGNHRLSRPKVINK